jgi:hypothetical protein
VRPLAPVVVALLTSAGALTACSSDSSTPPASTQLPAAVAPPTSGEALAFGAWAQPVNGYNQEKQKQAVLTLEKSLGHKLAFDHFFAAKLPPASTFAWRLKWDAEQQRVPMITFGFGADTEQVVAGDFDDTFASYADAIRESGADRVLLRYAHEMDGVKNQSWVHSGPAYVAAWKHVHRQFKGLPVEWVWSPNAPAFAGKTGGVDQYWPGDDAVDWVGADGYNFYTCQNHKSWKSFDEIFAPFLAWGEAKDKPLMIPEFGTLDDPKQPVRQAQWLADAVATANRHPQLKALVYFDSDGQECDWRLDSSGPTTKMLARLGTTDKITTKGSTGND